MIYDVGKKCEICIDIGSFGIVGFVDDFLVIEEEEFVCYERGYSFKLVYVESFFQFIFVLLMVFFGCLKFILEYIYYFLRLMVKYILFLCFFMDFKDLLFF